MNLPDFINGTFEAGGALANIMHIRQVLRDRIVRGVHWFPALFYTAWGVWNVWWYQHLAQSFSWWAGLAVLVVNATYFVLLLKYWPRGALTDADARRGAVI